MDLGLAGKKALVTGATKGIGRAIVELLLAEGASVALCARNAEEVDKAVAELSAGGGTVFGATADAADSESLRGFIAAAIQALGGLDIYVHNTSGKLKPRINPNSTNSDAMLNIITKTARRNQ